jgi:uncharacterized protein (DUF885 family)
MRKVSILLLIAAALFATSCGVKPIDIEKLRQDFIGSALALSPINATQIGFHRYQEVDLDDILDDYSERGVQGMRIFLNTMHVDVGRMDSSKLDAETRVDLDLIRKYCEAQLLDLDKIQTYKHNPTMYVELIGAAINTPFTLNYEPEGKRFGHIIARLEKIPAFLNTAKSNLVDAPEIWNKVAQQENQGNIDLIDHEVRAKVPPALKRSYDEAAAEAVTALKSFNSWLENVLRRRPGDWRLGHDLYAQEFKYALANGETPEQTLAAAETKLNEIRSKMQQQAGQLWPKYYPAKSKPRDLNELVSAVLDKIAKQHAAPDQFFDSAEADLSEATQFVKAHDILPLPKGGHLEVIPTPEFMRGVYGVGGFQPAPPLEPKLGAFFWITPITPDMPKADVESKLREYNRWGLQTLVIHEAMPGHWVQFQYANAVQPQSRAVLREMLANNPYVEGWAVYATQVMIDEGYEASPEMTLTFEKQMLRVVANTILDVKMQTQGMTDQQALDLMINQTFQERQEAVAKVQRAKLTACQLPTYFVGWQAWLRLRDGYEKKNGSNFNLSRFHERALNEGSVPMATLSKLMLE